MPEAFQLETQQKLNWCWAAVTSGVQQYLSGKPVRQCEVANGVVRSNGVDFCHQLDSDAEDSSNVPMQLDHVLAEMQVPFTTSFGSLEFSDLKKEIDDGRPVCVRIGWLNGGGHFVVLCGYRESLDGSRPQVFVSDPWYADSLVDYDSFCNAYQNAGKWTHTFRLLDSGDKNR